MVVDLKNLRNFVAVASAGSISRAAENIHIAQPALSKQIQQIEDYFGTDLFVRTHRGVKLTPAGERLVNHAKGLLKRFDIALEDVREAISEPSGRVALGLPQSMAKYLAVPLVRTIDEHRLCNRTPNQRRYRSRYDIWHHGGRRCNLL